GVREGDNRAFEQLCARHRPYIHQAVSWRIDSKLRSRVDPSDVVQETLLHASRGLARYLHDVPLPFRLWLRRIAQDRLLMARRQHVDAAKRTVLRELPLPNGSSQLLGEQLLSTGDSPSQQLARKEMARKVRQAVSRLPEADSEIVILVSFEGLNSQEAALVLGMPPATVRRRYGRALVRLRELLGEDGTQESSP
ncbi:MAG: sigma-70 family RNA polymerase sigma factor, partial [Planctomycetes bacterium]|nr:sigma-70 family RNA polymerase sigma factor [Planctomycetota bacterium]